MHTLSADGYLVRKLLLKVGSIVSHFELLTNSQVDLLLQHHYLDSTDSQRISVVYNC